MSTFSASLFISILLILVQSDLDEDKYKDCLWFGYGYDTPIYPIGICTTYQNEYGDTEDGLYTYSNMYQCEENGGLKLVEWDNENCVGNPWWNYSFPKDSNYYYWNCDDNAYPCPYTKIKLYQLYNDTEHDDHGEHLCTIDTNVYEEIALITNVCIDVDYMSFYLDCDANSVTMTGYDDNSCSNMVNKTVITEGCDDPLEWDRYVQVAECEDADYDGGGGDDDGGNGDNKNNDLAIIFTIIIAAIIIILVLIIGIGITRRNKLKVSTNKDLKEPINVSSFNRLNDDIDHHEEDNNLDSPQPDNQQDITGGDDVDEIQVDDNEMR